MKDLETIYNFPYKVETLKAKLPAKENDIVLFTYTDEQLTEMIKAIKALEIIKNKEINIHALLLHMKRFDKPDGYNALVGAKYQITQEEYDLLKEVLL